MPAVGEVRELVETFDPGRDGKATHSRALVLALLESPAPFSRDQYDPGHLTASGIVLSPDRGSMLLVYHRRLARWLQPGGHIEPQDATMVGAARREILEETGVRVDEGVTAVVVGVDVHIIPAARGEPEHRHHDIAFRFVAATMALPASEERNEVRWCPVGDLGRYSVDLPLQRSVERAIRQKEWLRPMDTSQRPPVHPSPNR